MVDRARDHIEHILQAIAHIEEDTAEQTIESFVADRRARQLVERNMEIVSEAARRLPDELLGTETQMPWNDIKGIGNILRHDYDKVRSEVLWDTVVNDIGPLKAAVARMRSRLLAGEMENNHRMKDRFPAP